MQPPPELDRQRKRSFFSWITLLALIVFPILMIINCFENDGFEALIDLLFLAIIITCFLVLKKSRSDTLVYRVSLFLISAGLFYSISVGIGQERMLYWPFTFPLLYFFFLGRLEGLLWTSVFTCGLAVLLLMPTQLGWYVYQPSTVLRFFINFIVISILSLGLESSRDRVSRLLAENNLTLELEKKNLEQALKEVKTLSGLIPICSICKNIRNDEGFWEKVDIYIRDHSEAVFSHSLCPDCLENHYPEIDQALKRKKKDVLPE